MSDKKLTGRVTIPTNLDIVPETIDILKRWGADAIRDCDGTERLKGKALFHWRNSVSPKVPDWI